MWTHTRGKRFGEEHEESKALQITPKRVSQSLFVRRVKTTARLTSRATAAL